jgi:hypothetical protein
MMPVAEEKVGLKGRRKLIAMNALLFAALFLLVTLNKEQLRPALWDVPVLGTLTGCLPNFLAAMLISLCAVNAVMTRKPARGRLIVYVSSGVIFLILAVEELRPMWGASTVFDVYDIVASALGSAAAVILYEIVSRRKRPARA